MLVFRAACRDTVPGINDPCTPRKFGQEGVTTRWSSGQALSSRSTVVYQQSDLYAGEHLLLHIESVCWETGSLGLRQSNSERG